MDSALFAIHVAEHFSQDLRRFLHQRAPSMEVEDLVQETYIRLLEIPDTTLIRNPRNYVLTTAAHVVSDLHERKGRWAGRSVVVNSGLVEKLAEYPSELPADTVAAHLIAKDQVRRLLKALPPLHAAVLLLFYRDQMSYTEIATQVGISTDRVERYLAAARSVVQTLGE